MHCTCSLWSLISATQHGTITVCLSQQACSESSPCPWPLQNNMEQSQFVYHSKHVLHLVLVLDLLNSMEQSVHLCVAVCLSQQAWSASGPNPWSLQHSMDNHSLSITASMLCIWSLWSLISAEQHGQSQFVYHSKHALHLVLVLDLCNTSGVRTNLCLWLICCNACTSLLAPWNHLG